MTKFHTILLETRPRHLNNVAALYLVKTTYLMLLAR